MKQMRLFHCIIILFTLQSVCLSGKNMISLFVRPFPRKKEVTFEKLLAKTQMHGKISYKILKETLRKHTHSGVLASYFGYVTPSNFNGQIVFPRKHQKDLVKLLITPMVTPIMMIGATVHHWESLPSLPARLYVVERKQDEATQEYYWNAQEEQIPENKHISIETIVLFADPKNILVPTGVTLTAKSPHLILPDIYVRKNTNIAVEALRVLKIKHFFMPVLSSTKKQNEIYYSRQW